MSHTKETPEQKISNCLWFIKTIRTSMLELQRKLSTGDIPDVSDELAYKRFQITIDQQSKQVEKLFNKMEDYFRDMPDKMDKLPAFSGDNMKRLSQTYTDQDASDSTSDVLEELLNAQNWNDGNQQFFIYGTELIRQFPSRKRQFLMEKRPQTISRWDQSNSPHSMFERALRQFQSELQTKKLGMWPTILERSAFGCIFEIKYGMLVERQPVLMQKMIVVENCGQIEMVKFVAPHEEWSYFEDFGSRRVDLTKQSRYTVYQKLTSQANLSLQVLMSTVNSDHKWTVVQIQSFLTMFSRYQYVFETPCRQCSKIMRDFLPCVIIDPRNPRIIAWHEGCRI